MAEKDEHEELVEPGRDEGLEELMALLDEEGVADEQNEAADMLAELEIEEDEPAPAAPPRRRSQRRHPDGDKGARRAQDDEDFKDLEAQLSAHQIEIDVSADGLTATAVRIGPEDTAEVVGNELERQGIRAGIETVAIEAALSRAAEGSPQYDVVVARGKAPVVHSQPQISMAPPPALVTSAPADPSPLLELEKLLQGGARDALEAWSGPALLVRPGQVIAQVSPAKVETGMDVHGNELQPETLPVPELQAGDNTALGEDGTTCRSEIYGYAGVVVGATKVVSPFWVSNDAMEACLVCLSPENNPVASAGELHDALKARWIEHGVDMARLESIATALQAHAVLPRLTTVAVGTKPKEGAAAKVKHHFHHQQLVTWRDLSTAMKHPDREALEQALASMTSGGRTFPTVSAGEVLLEKEAFKEGVEGRDVLGEVLEPEAAADEELDTGENVVLDEAGARATATCFGYVAVYGSEQISVVSPLWLAADRMELCFVNLPQGEGAKYPDVAGLEALVETDRRLSGVDVSAWGQILERIEAGEDSGPLITIAQGEAPQLCRDASFEWAIEMGGRVGTEREDGSIDLRDRRLILVVAEGQLVGKRTPGQEGVPGTDVFGKALVPRPPTDLEVVTDNRIRSEDEDEGVTAYYAEQDGGVNQQEEQRGSKGRVRKRLRIGLSAVSEIEGDIDYSTGHVDFAGDVVIKGSVKPLFKVKATGSVSIGGNVEEGAQVVAGKHVEVGGGIVGAKIRVSAGGCVVAKFLQQASVRAGEDVEVAGYIFDAFVQASGSLTVAGAGQGSSLALVGGTIWAGGGIETPSLGSPSNPHIRLVVGIDPMLKQESDELQEKLRLCDGKLSDALAQLGLGHLDTGRIERKANAAELEERAEILLQARAVAEFGDLRRHLGQRLDEIAVAQRELAKKAKLSVAGAICAGPELRIGERVISIDQDARGTGYRLDDEDGQFTIVAESL